MSLEQLEKPKVDVFVQLLIVSGDALTTVGSSSVRSTATDAFRFLGHWLPLRPFPLGAVAWAYFVKLGARLFFLNHETLG